MDKIADLKAQIEAGLKAGVDVRALQEDLSWAEAEAPQPKSKAQIAYESSQA